MEINMFIDTCIARSRDFVRLRTVIGILGAVSANVILAAFIEHLTRVAAFSVG
jgi:hypothetical protein